MEGKIAMNLGIPTATAGRGSTKRIGKKSLRDNLELGVLTLPALILFVIFCYIPMYGVIIAFKHYTYTGGILGSKWCNFDNFKFFFTSQDAWLVTRNTVGYGILFLLTGTVASIVIALLAYEIGDCKGATKFYQTSMTLPRFMSWVVVGYIVYIMFDPIKGVANTLITSLGGKTISWYTDVNAWPYILTVVNLWKNVGMNSLLYFAALSGIDVGLYEAAKIDGAGRIKQIWHISIPGIMPVIAITTILATGGIIRGDFGLFYNVPLNQGLLYPATDVIDTYVYRGLQGGNMSGSAAVGLFQSVVGLFLVVGANLFVKKISPENSLF